MLKIVTWCLAVMLIAAQARPQGSPPRNVNPDAVARARRALAEGTADAIGAAVHAATLLDADDVSTLKQVLGGDNEAAISGTLQAMRVRGEDRLLTETLELAAWARWESVAELAQGNLAELAAAGGPVSDRVLADLVQRLGEVDRPQREVLVLIEVLGASRNLAAVEPLIGRLRDPHELAAHAALQRLTGHDPRPPGAPSSEWQSAWQEFWNTHERLPRDRLLELALELAAEHLVQEQLRHADERAAMVEEVVEARNELMGQDIDQLIAGLSYQYAAVRRTAAERLASHDNKQQAAAALPVILRRLGYGEDGLSLEDDPRVRASLVAALGVLGRQQEQVRSALAAELSSEHPAVAQTAVGALSLVRGESDVVRPLLDYLDRNPLDADATVNVLTAVAENHPRGEIRRLRVWLGASHPARVRAAAARALLASEDVLTALDQLVQLDVPGQEQAVRYAVAAALGERVIGLDPDSPARARIVSALGNLLDDLEPSVRAQAASSLGESADLGALVLLEERSKVETEVSVLEKLVTALGDLGYVDGVRVIGRICGQRSEGNVATLQEAGRAALASIGGQFKADGWLAMGQQLLEVSAMALAAWCFQETETKFSPLPEYQDVVLQARGLRAEALWELADYAEAKKLLLELNQVQAPYPPERKRLELLALTCEKLENYSNAAGYFLALLELVPVGAAGREGLQRAAARVLRKAGRFDEALVLIDELVKSYPGDNELLYERAKIEEGLGLWERSLETLRRLLERIPSEDGDFHATVLLDIERLSGLSNPTAAPDDDGEAEP